MSCPPATKRQDPCPQVEDFVSRLEVLEYGRKAAAHYGDIRADLERKGTVIGVNDLHIAGHARSEGMTWLAITCGSLSGWRGCGW